MTDSNLNLPELRTLFYRYLENPFSQTFLPDFLQTGYNQNFADEKIIKQFQPVIEAQVKQTINGWGQTYRRQLGDFIELLEKLTRNLEELDQAEVTASTVWRNLVFTLKAIKAWTKLYQPEITSLDLWTDLNSLFSENLRTLPELAHVQVPYDYWADKPEDRARLRLWKKKKRIKIKLRNSVFTARNQFRRLFRRAPVQPAPLQRRFDLHCFLIYFLELPTAEFLLTEWQYFLQQIANQLYELHLGTIEIKNDFLDLADFERAVLSFDQAELSTKREKLQLHLQAITFHYQQLDQFESDSIQRFQVFEAEVYEKIWQQWQLVGTYRLSKSDFDRRQIARSWKKLEIQLAETKASWQRHFQGELGEWQTDVELALLQLQTAQICCHLLHRLEQKISGQVIPTFATTQESLTTLLKNFQELDTDDLTGLRDAVVKRNRFILKFLQRDKLPLLMDTLIKAQLDKVIASWGAGTRNAIENLSNEHIVFKQRDLNSPIPNSKIQHILNLKKVALEDLSSKYESRYHTLILEIQHNLEAIFRGISEIDQTVEVNLKATLTPLSQRHGTIVVEEVRNMIVEGLTTTSLQLKQVVVQAEELRALSTRHILQITLDLENQLQVLGNAESIAELYLRLPSVTPGKKFQIRCRKFFLTFKAAPATLIGISAGIFQQIQSNYFRLREMTGLTSEKADAAENLSQFLIDTEKHISNLPYVYQRLFRLEPLSDEQFFTARAEEIELLKGEFNRWQNEKFTATALIGERGCGITSLLNIAEKHIYKDYPAIRIDFLDGETIFTEAGLFDFFKSAFKKANIRVGAKNMDELEHKIKALEERQVFIVENLQQLFLRTTYGFDALERFMLFISRTHLKIHWVMTCALYSWEFLAKVINIDEYIQQKIVLDTLPQAALEEIILQRHRASNYKLLFKAPEEVTNSRRFRKLSSEQARQAFLQSHFFKQLTELAAGNITVAILLWLRSYTEFTQDKLIIPASIDFDPTFLYKLSPEELFTLIAVLQHDILTAEDHALVFHQELQQSLLLLNRMANKGFLVQKSNGYQIHPFLYRPVVRVLKSSNIIH